MDRVFEVVAVYADGGVIDRSPSSVGGTWAFCLVDCAGNHVTECSDVVDSVLMGTPLVTNNQTEFYALVRALEALPPQWQSQVYSDSQMSLGRLSKGWKCTGLPQWLIDRAQVALFTVDFDRIAWTLLGGHPTKAEMAAGVGKRGYPVSAHNVWCDKACQKEAEAYRLKERLCQR